eukprot:753637-Hanusia_phi.AAC.3
MATFSTMLTLSMWQRSRTGERGEEKGKQETSFLLPHTSFSKRDPIPVDNLRHINESERLLANKGLISHVLENISLASKVQSSIHQTFIPVSWLQGRGLDEILDSLQLHSDNQIRLDVLVSAVSDCLKGRDQRLRKKNVALLQHITSKYVGFMAANQRFREAGMKREEVLSEEDSSCEVNSFHISDCGMFEIVHQANLLDQSSDDDERERAFD